MIDKFMNIIVNHIYTLFVDSMVNQSPIECLMAEGKLFRHHPSAFYALNVCFQQTNRPTGNHAKSKPFYFSKHHLYGVKSEAVLSFAGLGIYASDAAKKFVSDKKICTNNVVTQEVNKKVGRQIVG